MNRLNKQNVTRKHKDLPQIKRLIAKCGFLGVL